jgi:hypothetical protein
MAILKQTSENTPLRALPAMDECIASCQDCHEICLATAIGHCLPMGGRHAAAEHVRLMLDCAEICQTAGNFMMRSSTLHTQICELCATICEQCARDCDRFSDDEPMRRCAETCRRCAASCRQMSGMRKAA